MSQSPYLFDVTAETFDRYVLENSFHKPVLVDFWAEWCAPCKALMPVLAKITESLEGELLLAKVNCDEQASLTERFGIRSLPTVVLFKDGQPVDGFAGVQPESAIRAMIEPYASAPTTKQEPEDDVAEQAAALLAGGAPEQAIALLQPALDAESTDSLRLLLARALLAANRLDEAAQVLSSVTSDDGHKQELAGLQAQLGFARQAADLPERTALQSRLAVAPDESEAIFALAQRDLADGEYESALAALLRLFQTDRSYADNSPQRTLLQVFDALGGDHALTIQYRRKMYQALY